MTFNNAKNLHNEDEVTIKETGEHKPGILNPFRDTSLYIKH